MNKYAIIVAGGKGVRMGSQTPKQFIAIDGVPIVVHTVRAFITADPHTKIILVLPPDQVDRWKTIAGTFDLENIQVVTGGEERFDSVKNGLSAINDAKGVVAVHDAVRPCIDPTIISHAYRVAQEKGTAVVCVPSKDSLRKKSTTGTEAVDRSSYFMVQTPQVFELQLLRAAYQQPRLATFTDDASVVDHMGHAITIVEGDYKNIKVTTPEDLLVAELYLK